GGLYECGAVIENNTIAQNSASEAGAIGYCFECITHFPGVIRNCILWGNVARMDYQLSEENEITYSCIQEWTGGGEGNISLTPHFVDAERGDYHLQSWSPCVDAGDLASPFGEEPDPNGGRVNMGAYGNTPEAVSKSDDIDADGLLDDWETYWFGNLHCNASDDPDQDLIPNFREYRFAWDPTAVTRTAVWNLTAGTRYETIQSALWESTDGEEILVYPGVYRENIRFLGGNVVLRSTVPTDAGVVAKTVIDGMGKGPVVAFLGTENDTCVLSGFTITNGKGGIWGGYVSRWGWDPPRYTHGTIQNNTITGNSDSGLAYCSGVIRNNLITNNSALSGGGLYDCDGVIENNVISNNSADDYGGGLYNCSGRIRGNTIVGNRADTLGGGIYGSALMVRNCILWGNAGSQVSGSPRYCCIEGWTAGGEGNIAQSPRFVDAENGNFRLLPDSPCIDTGFNDPELPETDIAGMHRIMFGGKSLTVDMGAYEFYVNKVEPVGGTGEAVLTWSSLWPKSYSIYYSDDLITWHVAVGALPSAGNETTSWTDDGSLTGVPPLLAPRRFYRLLENP
ncbi:MAG: right-handed parallel beta-helix repeat-containing protein, partial [bacterium]|nr:right-handed parallel beta-helix repeat-containing protein [bacterium]